MHYEVNVSLHGKHVFATAPHSLTDQDAARRVFDLLRARFPESEGYEVTCSHVETRSRPAVFAK